MARKAKKEPNMSENQNTETETAVAETNQTVETAEGGPKNAEAATAAATATAADERYKTVEHPVTGQTVRRLDYIRELWVNGMARGDIAKHLTEITKKKVPYQIVFAATKGLAGGPVKVPAAAPAAPAPVEASTASATPAE